MYGYRWGNNQYWNGQWEVGKGGKDDKNLVSTYCEEQYRQRGDGIEVVQEENADCNQELLRKDLLPIWPSFLEKIGWLCREQKASCHSVYTFEPWHSQRLRISKLVKESTDKNFSFGQPKSEELQK